MAAKKISDDSQKLRLDHNRDLIRRMRNGESLTSFDSKASWYPPRPVIEKDQNAMDRLYSDDGAPTEKSKKTHIVSERSQLKLVP